MDKFQETFFAVIDAQHPGTADILKKLAKTIDWNQVMSILVQALTSYAPKLGPFAPYLQIIIDDLFPPASK